MDNIKELHTIADNLIGLLSADKISDFRNFIDHNEVIIGLEILLEQIYESDVVLTKKDYEILEKVGKGRIDDDYFEGIRVS